MIIFNEQSDILVDKLNANIGKDVNIFPFITLCTLDIICGNCCNSLLLLIPDYFVTLSIQKRQWDVTSMPKARAILSTLKPYTSK